MPPGMQFKEIYSLLPFPLETEHFAIRYGPYVVGGRPEGGYRSHRGMGLVTAYADGLEASFEWLQRFVFRETQPRLKIPVAVCHIPDWIFGRANAPTTVSSETGPTILLSNRSFETSVSARADRARTEATHEVCHVFQFEKRPPVDDIKRREWARFNDAMAVACEQLVNRGGAEGCFYFQDWLDSPDKPLDLQSYSACMFVRWIARRFSNQTLGDIWEKAGKADTPLDTIERLTGNTIDDLFTEYTRDAYFLCDYASHCFFPDIHFLWGFREIRERFVLPSDNGKTFPGSLDHLASVYFEVRANEGVAAIECSLESVAPTPILRGEIAAVQRDLRRRRSARIELRPIATGRLRAEVRPVTDPEIDHFVIVVSNGSRNKDREEFRLTVNSIL
jgi:hypothetical protein